LVPDTGTKLHLTRMEGVGVRSRADTHRMLCPLTGVAHRLFWMRSAWWCRDCRQKIETCCEGDCPTVVC
jgi:hypothetical protein